MNFGSGLELGRGRSGAGEFPRPEQRPPSHPGAQEGVSGALRSAPRPLRAPRRAANWVTEEAGEGKQPGKTQWESPASPSRCDPLRDDLGGEVG